jgi:Nuclease-related domain
MPHTEITRWTRYGKDRVYVKLADTGQQIGWIDVKTGTVTVDVAEHTTELLAAITEWKTSQSATGWSIEPPSLPLGAPVGTPLQPPTPTTALPAPDTTWAAPSGLPLAFPSPQSAPLPAPLPSPSSAAIVSAAPTPTLVSVAPQPSMPAHTTTERVIIPAAKLGRLADRFRRPSEPQLLPTITRPDVHDEMAEDAVQPHSKQDVAKALAALPEGWFTLHSVPVVKNGPDINHVVIGPGGVFTLNTKQHPKTQVGMPDHVAYVNEQQRTYRRDSRIDADKTTQLLDRAGLADIAVQPVLVFLGAEVTAHSVSDVLVASVENICDSLLSLPTSLTPLQVQAVYNTAKRHETWSRPRI